jgi:hypothetical protein
MKKVTLGLMMAGIAASLCFTSCSKKMRPAQTAQAPAPKPANDPTMVPFTKSKKQQLERNNADIKQLQFYVDQKIILRPMGGADREVVKNGAIVKETQAMANEIVIPELTPVVCDRVSGDTLMISFEASGNRIAFVAPYGSNNFSIAATNWINGSADVMYNNQTYRIICGSCGNIAEATLLVKEATNAPKQSAAGNATTVQGRKVGYSAK